MRDELDRKAMATLSGGHLAVDFASGAVPALLPFFVLEFDLSYTATAALMLAVLASSSFVQPLFGLWSDRRGAVVAAAGRASRWRASRPGSLPSRRRYVLVLLLVFLGGIGIAAYHPEGAKFAAYASGRKRACGMSYFNIGGNTGYALGPIVVTPLVLWLGLTGGLVAMLPGRRSSRSCSCGRSRRSDGACRQRDRACEGAGDDDVRAMTVLGGVIALRSVAWFGLLTFVPLWVVAERGHGGGGEPRALADARRRRGRHARARPRRRPGRAAPDARRHAGGASVPHRRVRPGGRVLPGRSR